MPACCEYASPASWDDCISPAEHPALRSIAVKPPAAIAAYEFDDLAPDADERTREDLAERLVPYLLLVRGKSWARGVAPPRHSFRRRLLNDSV
jgi:hypothetical protein